MDNEHDREDDAEDGVIDESETPESIDVQPEDPREPGRASPEPID